MPRRLIITLLLTWSSTLVAGPVEVATDPVTGLATAKLHSGGIEVSLTQLLPDQVRAFYQGRGFSAAESERIAGTCVFQTVVRNDTETADALEIALADWRVRRAGHAATSPRTIEAWLSDWGEPSLGQAQAIALRWALFPAVQSFAPGDWNMGMLTVEVPHGERFDLELHWRLGERPDVASLSDLRCAGERP